MASASDAFVLVQVAVKKYVRFEDRGAAARLLVSAAIHLLKAEVGDAEAQRIADHALAGGRPDLEGRR